MGKEGKFDLKLAPGLDAGDEDESDCNVSCTNNGGQFLFYHFLLKNKLKIHFQKYMKTLLKTHLIYSNVS